MGAWKKVEPGDKIIKDVDTPFIGKEGELKFNEKDYLALEKNQKKQLRKLKKLKPGVYKLNRK